MRTVWWPVEACEVGVVATAVGHQRTIDNRQFPTQRTLFCWLALPGMGHRTHLQAGIQIRPAAPDNAIRGTETAAPTPAGSYPDPEIPGTLRCGSTLKTTGQRQAAV
jgi:hypothetical protein